MICLPAHRRISKAGQIPQHKCHRLVVCNGIVRNIAQAGRTALGAIVGLGLIEPVVGGGVRGEKGGGARTPSPVQSACMGAPHRLAV